MLLLERRKRFWMWSAKWLGRVSSFLHRRAGACDKRYFALVKGAAAADSARLKGKLVSMESVDGDPVKLKPGVLRWHEQLRQNHGD